MKNIYLFQPQYSENINGILRYWLPYSCGCIWSYAQQFDDIIENWNLPEIIFKRESIDQLLERLDNPAVCGFSCYIWNERYNLELAKRIKNRWPNCVIFFGGPQTNSEYLAHDFIDCLIQGEGEESVVELLRSVDRSESIPKFWPKQRIQDLSSLPAVYSSGVFDQIIKKNTDCLFNAVLETNRGCPFQCTFCDWGSLTYSKVKKFAVEKIEKELSWLSCNPVSAIFLADANFGIFKDRDLQLAEIMKQYFDKSETIDYVNVTYTKNSNESVYEIAKALMPYTKSVTVSVQSMNDDTLVAIKRTNMKFNDFKNHLELSHRYGVPTYTEMILGMPEETIESWKTGITELLEAGQHNQIDVFFTMMIKNSELNSAETKFRYKIKTVTVDNYMVFSEDDQDDPLAEKADIICQTNTMSLEELVESYMYAWMIGNFHTSGYSQLISKYCRHVLNITYRKFYDRLFEYISTEKTCVREEYQEMISATTDLMTKGRFDNLNVGVNHIAFYHYALFYHKKSQLIDLAIKVAETFGEISEEFKNLQHHFVFDQSHPKVRSIVLPYDLDTWQKTPTDYQICTRIDKFEPTYNQLILQRKRGNMKNLIKSGVN